MSTTYERYPGTTGNDASYGTYAWSGTFGASYKTISPFSTSASSNYLTCTNFLFDTDHSGAMLDTDIIDTVVIRLKTRGNYYNGPGNAYDDILKLIVAGSIVGTSNASASVWPAWMSAADATYDYTVAQWGVTLTGAQVKATTFGFALSVKEVSTDGFAEPRITNATMQLTYHAAPAGGPIIISSMW